MTQNERETFRNSLWNRLEPSDELQERFDQQVKDLVQRQLSKAEKIRDIFLSVVFTIMTCIFAVIVFFVTTVEDSGLTPATRLFMACGFTGGAIVFLAGAIYAMGELRAGRIASRQKQQAMVVLSAGFTLLFFVSHLLFAPRDLPVEKLIWMNIGMLFFWIMAVGFVVVSKSQWQHEDALLEQKRTQLEIAMLREDLRQKR